MMRSHGLTEWAQGSLRLLSAAELLALLARRRFSGRLTLISPNPRLVVSVLLADGRPTVVMGSGIDAEPDDPARDHRPRQVLLEALGWTVGTFRVEAGSVERPQRPQSLGNVEDLLMAARERERAWPGLMARLPAPIGEVMVAPRAGGGGTSDPVRSAVASAVTGPTALGAIPAACRLDDHVAIAAVLDLAEGGELLLGTAGDVAPPRDPRLIPLVRALLDLLQPSSPARTLKVTVLSWDAATCFRAVEALCGRDRRPPEDAESQPSYQILHEISPLGDGYRLEVLAFRDDTFEPTFAAPLVQDCHIFLVFSDHEAGHLRSSERPLVERLNQIRAMFHGSSVAARITIGADAVTDPGSDLILPEISRHLSWSELLRPRFLAELLERVADRLGVAGAQPAPPSAR